MANQLFAKKTLEMLHEEMNATRPEHQLKRVLGPWHLTALGVGAIIGTGIFVLTGVAAHDHTGPALMLSFVVSGLACIFAALCYAEFASMAPVAGSAYTYSYSTLGELFAWIIGWDLVLEYAVASSTVAHGWSHYFQDFINILGTKVFGMTNGLHLPHIFTNAPFDYDTATGHFVGTGTILDLPALVITIIITILLIRGVKESANVNAIIVATKVAVVLFVIAVGAFFVKPENWHPFAPFGLTGISFFGHTVAGQTGAGGEPLGMIAGAAIIFFAYIGFDAVSTQAEEAKNPKRDVPIGIIASLVICTILYIAVSAVLTGMVRYDQINVDAPVSTAFGQVGLPWAQFLISLGAMAGITSVLLVMMLGQPRILLAMSRDGLLPKAFAAVHPKFHTPYKGSIITGIFVGTLASFLPLRILAELVNIGTLLAFVMVCGAVLAMRKISPNAERPFKAPWFPFVPVMGIAICLLLMFSLPAENWVRLIVWLLIGFLIYFGYGKKHSVLNQRLTRPTKSNVA